jgi:hypothetical protein
MRVGKGAGHGQVLTTRTAQHLCPPSRIYAVIMKMVGKAHDSLYRAE